MLRTVGRLLLFRVLPRRLLPILTVVEVAQLLRSARRQRMAARARRQVDVGDPRDARGTAERGGAPLGASGRR